MYRAREKQKDEFNDERSDEFLDCHSCKAQYDRKQRAGLGCAWIPEAERNWADKAGIEHALSFHPIDECPGMAIGLPQVIEAARAASWATDGLLQEFYEGEQPTRLALDCIEILRASVRQIETEDARERRRDMRKTQNGGA